MSNPYPLGAKPDRYDPRDYRLETAMLAPEAATLDRKFWSMVNPDFRIDQGAEGTCVGHAMTNVLLAGPSAHRGYADFATADRAHEFARRLYLEASGDASYQQGMYPRDACKKLLEWGLIGSYWKVLDIEDIITALLTFGPVTIAVPWYTSMFYPDNTLAKAFGNYWVKVNMESTLAGYHDIALTGIDMAPDNGAPPFVRIENSWGLGWGWDGTGRLTIESLRRLNIWDNWALREEPF